MADPDDNPALLVEHDTAWRSRAAQCLDEIRAALEDLAGSVEADFDHIGSTSVPGLLAKPFIDLQVRILPLPSHMELTPRLGPLGYERARGARPDSPGVDRDIPRSDEIVPDEVWEKRLYVARERSVILHLRRSDSPWGRHTVWFREWLRARPDARRRYELTKRELSQQSVGKPDYDEYTRAKTAFFDEVQPEFTTWAQTDRNVTNYGSWST